MPAGTKSHLAIEPLTVAHSVFDRIVVGIDGTEPSFEACRQIARLAEEHAAIEAASVVHLDRAIAETLQAAQMTDILQQEADAALEHATEILGERTHTCCLDGFATPTLLDELRRFDATLIALGAPAHRRATEILIGGVAGELLHEAPCSVLIARQCRSDVFPRRVVVGQDGSPASDAALFVANRLSARLNSSIRVLTALGGKRIEPTRAELRTPFVEIVDRHPVPALVAAGREADLLVLGSRGLHGIKALGSVSERVAYQAHCSVLVVRLGA